MDAAEQPRLFEKKRKIIDQQNSFFLADGF
jgi:hypothetical protein